ATGCCRSSRRPRRSGARCSVAAPATSSTSPSTASFASGRSATSAEHRDEPDRAADHDQRADQERTLAETATADREPDPRLDERVRRDRDQDRDHRRDIAWAGLFRRGQRHRVDIGEARDRSGNVEALVAEILARGLRRERDDREGDAEPERVLELERILDLDRIAAAVL